jgi:hypothetical protein
VRDLSDFSKEITLDSLIFQAILINIICLRSRKVYFYQNFFKKSSFYIMDIIDSLPEIFDYKAYLEKNPDLVAAGINDQKLAIDHYLKHGRYETRFMSYLREDLSFKYLKGDGLEIGALIAPLKVK